MTDELGSTHHRERTIIGNCIAIAAELAQAAAPEEIVISDAAYQSVAARFSGSQSAGVALPKSAGGRAWRLGVERLVADTARCRQESGAGRFCQRA